MSFLKSMDANRKLFFSIVLCMTITFGGCQDTNKEMHYSGYCIAILCDSEMEGAQYFDDKILSRFPSAEILMDKSRRAVNGIVVEVVLREKAYRKIYELS